MKIVFLVIEWFVDQKDLKQIAEIVRAEVSKNNFMLVDLMDVKLNMLKNKIEKELESKMLTWKSEIIDAVDTLAGEIRDEREFREIASHQISDHSERIEKIEKRVFGVKMHDFQDRKCRLTFRFLTKWKCGLGGEKED